MDKEKRMRAQAALDALTEDELPGAAAALEALAASRGTVGGPFTRFLGIDIMTCESGHCICALDADERVWNVARVVHGGATFTLVDFSMGGAIVSLLKPTQRTTTLDIQIRYLAPARRGRLTAETRVRHQGNHIVVLDSQVTNEQGTLIATASGAFYVLDKASKEK